MDGRSRLKQLLVEFNIRKGDIIFLHSSYKRISYLKITPAQILTTIMDIIGDEGTLVLPSYGWVKSWDGYREYFVNKPVFDVINTPANIGYIPETFRLMPGVRRSLSYWWPVCAWGKLGDLVTRDQEIISDYYGQGSSFAILHENDVKILGLGVSLNTTSLSPIVDYRLGKIHSQKVFTEKKETGLVIDWKGDTIETKSHWLLPEYVCCTKPSRIFEIDQEISKKLFRRDEGTTIQFCYNYKVYYHKAWALGLIASDNNQRMPWLENYEGAKNSESN